MCQCQALLDVLHWHGLWLWTLHSSKPRVYCAAAACPLTQHLVCVCLFVYVQLAHHTEIFQCFLSAREVARSRDRERTSSSTGLGSGSVSRSVGGEEDTVLSQEGRRGSTGLPEGQDLYTAACNSVIHRCALLLLGVSPVLGELTKQDQEEGQSQSQSATGTQESLSFMTRSECCTLMARFHYSAEPRLRELWRQRPVFGCVSTWPCTGRRVLIHSFSGLIKSWV